jgi:hypothetical protein
VAKSKKIAVPEYLRFTGIDPLAGDPSELTGVFRGLRENPWDRNRIGAYADCLLEHGDPLADAWQKFYQTCPDGQIMPEHLDPVLPTAKTNWQSRSNWALGTAFGGIPCLFAGTLMEYEYAICGGFFLRYPIQWVILDKTPVANFANRHWSYFVSDTPGMTYELPYYLINVMAPNFSRRRGNFWENSETRCQILLARSAIQFARAASGLPVVDACKPTVGRRDKWDACDRFCTAVINLATRELPLAQYYRESIKPGQSEGGFVPRREPDPPARPLPGYARSLPRPGHAGYSLPGLIPTLPLPEPDETV